MIAAWRGFIAALAVLLLPIVVAVPQDEPLTSRLLAMLSQVPQEVALVSSGWATVRFVDYAALFWAEGIEPLRMLGRVDLLMANVPLGGILGRIAAGPEALSYVFSAAGQMAGSVGFEWLLHVDRSLEFGDLPNVGLLLDGGFDPEAIGSALQGRGFSSSTVDGITVWHRFEDLRFSFAARDIADPFGGHLGAAARVALLPQMLANARTWPLIQAVIATARDEGPSLADDMAYRALAEAITGPEGVLIQALFFEGIALRYAGDPLRMSMWLATEELETLPPFSLAVLADRQEGEDQVHLIGLVCADPSTAHVACEVLVRRVETFRLPDRPNEVLAEQYGAAIRGLVVERSEDGVAVALVEARYPLPAPRTDPDTGLFNVGGLLYRTWVRAIMRREFTPLW